MLLITETLTETTKAIVEEVGGKKKYFIEGIFAQSEVRNRNKRVYPKKVLSSQMEQYIKEYVDTRRALGELNHPPSPVVNPERASHLITSLVEQGNDWYGKAKVLNTPMGNVVRGLLEDNVSMGVSTRGLGTVHEGVVQSDFKIKCVDVVADPSAPSAFVNGIMEGAEWVWDNGILVEKHLEGMKKQINKQARKIQVIKNIGEAEFLNQFQNIFEGSVDPTISKIASTVSGKNIVDMRKPLESIFTKKDIDFVFSPVPHFRIKHKGKTIVIVNKKYADDAELIQGDVAIGYEGKI